MDEEAAEKIKARRAQTLLLVLIAAGILLPLALYLGMGR